VWIISAGYGFHRVLAYKSKAGVGTRPPSAWPVNNVIQLPSRTPLLVMFAHPQCPCTKASLAQLEQLAALRQRQFQAAVVFYQPKGASKEWSDSSLVRQAKAIPGVQVISDSNAELATTFNIQTSGHTLLYSPRGELLFSGGITSARGHIGDNSGFAAVSRILTIQSMNLNCSSTPVFGCELINPCARNKLSNQN